MYALDKIQWSANLAYVVGLITTDGNLSLDGRHIEFTSKDLQLIRTFKKCLGIKNKIGLKTSGFSDKKYPHVQFGDVKLYHWLLKIGLSPRKSKTMAGIDVPDKYFPDFLRGHFDGDGCCYSYWDERWHSSFMLYITFVSASEKHILWLRQRIKNLTGVLGGLPNITGDRIHQLRYAKKESSVLISKMYYKENLPCLMRKHKKLKKILMIENEENGRVL